MSKADCLQGNRLLNFCDIFTLDKNLAETRLLMSGKIDYFTLVRRIQEGRIKNPIFLFHGIEHYLRSEAVRFLSDHYLEPAARDFNLLKLDAKDVDSGLLTNELNALPIFSDYRVVIIEGAEKYFASGKQRSPKEEEIILQYLDNPNDACCLIFLMTGKPDSRKKLFKTIQSSGQIVEFAELKEAQLSAWIREELEKTGRRITPEALNYLITNTGNQLSVIEQEFEKLILYAPEAKEISLEMVRMTVGKTAGAVIFDLVDAVGEKKTARAIDVLREMLVAGEPPVYILFMLARQYRLMLSVKSLLGQRIPEKQIQSKLSLHPYAFKKVLQQTRNFEIAELHQGLRDLLAADVSLKNSSGDSWGILEMAILKISSRKACCK